MSRKVYDEKEVGDTPTLACLAPQPDNFISPKLYGKKYGIEFRRVASACGNGALIAQKRPVLNKNLGIMQDRWFVYDIPPSDHPKWDEYIANVMKTLVTRGNDKKFDPKTLLERFDTERAKVSHTNFRLTELAKMLRVTVVAIRRWTEIGVKDYGKLPRIQLAESKHSLVDDDGVYTSVKRKGIGRYGRIDYFYSTIDVRRFLMGELVAPNLEKFNTIDDAMSESNVDQIAAEAGFYVWNPANVANKTYDGFIRWAESKIFVGKGKRKMPFRANDKQRELYKAAFMLTPEGTFHRKVICTSRPRGDYKTFDIALLALFRFFNMEKQTIFFVTNSVEQTTHLLFKESINVIKNSPELLATPGLDIQAKGIYLMGGRGKENIFSQIEMISVEGGARSNADCFACSEVWKMQGGTDIAEIATSTRGVDDGWFLAESTVAPKGHWFHQLYTISQEGEDDQLYFQYYDSSERRNPKIDEKYLKLIQKAFPIEFKALFHNKWEDAAWGMFPEARVIEARLLGYDGVFGRTPEMLKAIDRYIELKHEIRKYGTALDTTNQRNEAEAIKKKFITLEDALKDCYREDILGKLEEIFNCEFVIGMGIDRAKHMGERSDRTVVSTVAKGVVRNKATDTIERMYVLLDLYLPEEGRGTAIMQRIHENIAVYGPSLYVDFEEYQAKDIYDECKESGLDADLVPGSYRHQEEIFTEMFLAFEGGYFKYAPFPVWADEEDRLIRGVAPSGHEDLFTTELQVFEHDMPDRGDKRRSGYFGSPFKKGGRPARGEPKDDTIYATAHAIWASLRGDVPASVRNLRFMEAQLNLDVIGDYR